MLTMTDAGLLLPCRRGADGEATFRMPPLAPRITVAHDYCLSFFVSTSKWRILRVELSFIHANNINDNIKISLTTGKKNKTKKKPRLHPTEVCSLLYTGMQSK